MDENDIPSQEERQLNPTGKPSLPESRFIQQKWSWRSVPIWLVLFLLAAAAALIWGGRGSYARLQRYEQTHDPFLEVTNREFSLFLWQFPSFLKVNRPKKTGYLPGFLALNENLDTSAAEEFVAVPPDLLFLYHTWSRLLAPHFIPRPISPEEFNLFLAQLPEWQPPHWALAPQGYKDLIESKDYADIDDLQTLPESRLPREVRQAFVGWKNYFLEGVAINALNPTVAQVEAFLVRYPQYARHFWRNIETIDGQRVAGIDYLHDLLEGKLLPDAQLPPEQVTPFLKVALFNAEQAEAHQ